MYPSTRLFSSPFVNIQRSYRVALISYSSPRLYGSYSEGRFPLLRRKLSVVGHLNEPERHRKQSIKDRLWREDWLCQAVQTDEAVIQQNASEEAEIGFLGKLSKLLGDVGMGRRSVWEGGVGAFLLGGALMAVGLVSWVRGTQLRQGQPYTVSSFQILHFIFLLGYGHFPPSFRNHGGNACSSK